MTQETKEKQDANKLSIEELKQQYSAAEIKQLLKEAEEEEQKEQERKKREYEQKRDQFVKEKVQYAKELSNVLSEFKQQLIENGHQLHDEMMQLFNVKKKDEGRVQNQFSLITQDGKFKLTIEKEEKVNLDESAEAGIEKIRNYMHTHVKKRDHLLYSMLEQLLMKNKKGEWDEKLVAKLSKYEDQIRNEEFSEGLDILRKAYRTVDSSYYVRFYEKNFQTGKLEHIQLQFSSL